MKLLNSKLGLSITLALGVTGCFSITLIGEVRDKVVRLKTTVETAPLGKTLSASAVSVSGGTGPYTFSVVSGPGTVDPSTGAITVNSGMLALETATLVVRATDTIGEYSDISIEVFRPGVVDRSFGGGNGYVVSTGHVATGGLARDPTTGRWLGTTSGGAELWDDDGSHLATLPNQVTGMVSVAGQRMYASASGGSAAIGGFYVPGAAAKLYVQRYDFTGASLFGGAGYYTAGGGPGGPDRVYGLNVLSNGRTLVTGTYKNAGGLQGGFLLQLSSTGTVVGSYTGMMDYPATAAELYAWDGVVETTGTMYHVALGRYIDGGGSCWLMWSRVDSGGNSRTGGVTDAVPNLCDSGNAGRVTPAPGPGPNRVYYGIYRTLVGYGRIIAFSPTSANVVTAFGGASGKVLNGFGNNTTIDRLITDPSGKVLACGRLGLTLGSTNYITRLATDGTVDTSFGNNGWIVYSPTTTGYDLCGELALDSTGSYLHVGFTSASDTAFYRLRYGK